MPPLSPLWLPLPNSTQVVGLLPLLVRALPLVLLQVAGALPLVLLQVAGALPLVVLRLSRGRRVVEAPFFGVLAAACTLGGPTAAASWTPPDLLPALLSELLVLLDELNVALKLGYISAETVIAGLKERPALTHVAVTGRGAPSALVERADLVTEMTVVHHPFREQGVKAQAGIEY